MNPRNGRTLLVGLMLVVLLGACSYSIRLPFAPRNSCVNGCDSADRADKVPATVRFLLGP